MKASYTLNQDHNGVEITFDGKPEAATLEALKESGYRWHRAKKLWYAKQTAERIALAKSITDGEAAPAPAATPAAEVINLDNLGQNNPHAYGADLAKAIREDLKRRGVKGCTVRARRVTYDTGITVTIKATEADFASLEEAKERYNFSHFTIDAERGFYNGEKWVYNLHEYSQEEKEEQYNKYMRYMLSKAPNTSRHNMRERRKDFFTITTAFYNKIVAVFEIANQWNYDNSDSMTDYFDVGYYLDIDIKAPESFEIREEMTEAEREAYAEEIRKEEEETAARIAAYKAEEEERRRQAEEAAKRFAALRETVLQNIEVIDLEESEQIYITNLVGGIGKECNIAELEEEIERSPHHTDALVTRKVVFSTGEAFAAFGELLMDDFDFLAKKGGTASEDVRLEGVKNIYSLTTEQRESIKWFSNNCVACYIGEELQLVSDPQGYNYCRYAYKPTAETETKNAAEELEAQRTDSESKTAFYFPEPVADQAKKLQPGQAVTVYQCDGWMLNSINGGAGIISRVEPGSYAQYTGIYIYFTSGKNAFIHDNRDCLIYAGIKEKLPRSVTERAINPIMSELLNADELFPRVLDYYGKQGETPIIDTIQR